MFYLVYKTTNLVNGKYYIGMHQTEDIEDGYLGSGSRFKMAVKKYGKENFKREVLYIFDNLNDMKEKEKELVDITVVESDLSYNLTIGGGGGNSMLGNNYQKLLDKWNNDLVFREKMLAEFKKNMSKALKRMWSDENYRKIQSDRMKERNKIMWSDENHIKDMKVKAKNGALKRFSDPEERNKIKKQWANIEIREKMSRAISNGRLGKIHMYHDNDTKKFRLISKEDVENKKLLGWKIGDKT